MPPKIDWPQLGGQTEKYDEHSTIILEEVNQLQQIGGLTTSLRSFAGPHGAPLLQRRVGTELRSRTEGRERLESEAT